MVEKSIINKMNDILLYIYENGYVEKKIQLR